MFGNPRSARWLFVYGGVGAALILMAFGIATVVIGLQGRADVRDNLARENIVGTGDSDIAGQKVDTGSEAQAFAETIRKHTLAITGGLTYSEMGRFMTPDGDPAGTNDPELAVKDETGEPIENPIRDTWVTATALTTALETAYFAEQVGLFAIVMGIALILTSIGFIVLSLGALRVTMHGAPAPASSGEPSGSAVDGTGA